MSKFKIGDHVRIKKYDRTGIIKAIISDDYMFGFWGDGYDYVIVPDDGCEDVTCPESALEAFDFILPQGFGGCECGATSVGVSKHADWCKLYEP